MIFEGRLSKIYKIKVCELQATKKYKKKLKIKLFFIQNTKKIKTKKKTIHI
jgi:hypothetical protein